MTRHPTSDPWPFGVRVCNRVFALVRREDAGGASAGRAADDAGDREDAAETADAQKPGAHFQQFLSDGCCCKNLTSGVLRGVSTHSWRSLHSPLGNLLRNLCCDCVDPVQL